MIGLKCLSLGSLFQSIGDNENAMKYLQMGKDALSVTHGKDSEIVKDAIALLQTIMWNTKKGERGGLGFFVTRITNISLYIFNKKEFV